MGVRRLKIGKLAEAANVNFETVRYYERIGLMPRPGRTNGGHRDYGEEHVRQLTFIRRARELGFAIEEIRSLLTLNRSGGPCANVKAIAAVHLADVREKLSALREMEQALVSAIDGCPGELPLCTILEMLDIGRDASGDSSPGNGRGPITGADRSRRC
jgi:MerR family transcriptional regulator, mercuric resistance operon regulatory protein